MTKTPVTIAVRLQKFAGPEDLPSHIKKFCTGLRELKDCPWAFDLVVCAGGNAPHAANKVAADFMRSDGRYLAFLDDDNMPEPEDLLRILSHREHIVGGMYVRREENGPLVMNPFREAKVDDRGLLPVGELGLGGLKTYHRSVFEHIIKQEPTLGYVEDDDGSTSWGFFCMGVVRHDGKSRFLTEDYWFDQLCRKHGILCHVDTKVKIRHRDRLTGIIYPLNDEWPDLPTPMEPMVPPPLAEDFEAVPAPGKLVLALQYWEGDKDNAMQLARFIADLEPGYREDVEFCFIKRFDATFDAETMGYVSNKFLVRVIDTDKHSNPGYPQSANFMSYSTMQAAKFWTDVKAVLLFEYDCIPVQKNWINQLLVEWDRAAGQGALVLGSWRPANNPLGHINGNMLFSPRLTQYVDLGDGPPKMAWDIYYPKVFKPVWMRSGLISNRHREENLSDARIQTPECGTKPPVLCHGAKDLSVWAYAKRISGA